MVILQRPFITYGNHALLLFICLSIHVCPLRAQDYWSYSSVQYDGEYFYAVADDLYQVVKTDKAGNVLQTFGNEGQGPGEFSTDKLGLALIDSVLYVLDNRGLHITLLDKRTFLSTERLPLKKPASRIINFRGILYGYVKDFEETNPFETGIMVDAFRPVDQLEDPGATLVNIRDDTPMNPFYDSEMIYAADNTVLIAREGRSDLTLFNGDSLYTRRIPGVEARALGAEIEGNTNSIENPIAKNLWKEKIMPQYMLITSAYPDGNTLYIQVHSYQSGDVLFVYNVQTDTFTKAGSLTNGKLIAVSGDTVYTLNETEIIRTSLSGIRSCRDEAVSFYFSNEVFDEGCDRCNESLLEWYGYARSNNIPVRIVLEDDSWFGKKEVGVQTLDHLKQWDLWGAIGYQKNCDGCFDSLLSARVTSGQETSEYYTFPAPLPSFKKELHCIAE